MLNSLIERVKKTMKSESLWGGCHFTTLKMRDLLGVDC